MVTGLPRNPLMVIGLCTLLHGCSITPVQIDYEDKVTTQQSQLQQWSQKNSTEAAPQQYLDDLLTSPTLDTLLTTAYQHNPTLQQTLLTLQIRQSQLTQTDAAQLPQLDFGFNASRSETTDTSYNSNLTISWQADLWGKLRNNTQAATLDVAEQHWLYQAAQDTLTAEIMSSWLRLTALQHATEIEQQRLATLKKNEQFILQRYRNGIGTLEDLDSARSAVSSSLASIEANQQSYRQQQRDLITLVGDLQLNTIPPGTAYPQVKLVLADLPEQTLGRRPDLQAAYQAIKADSLRTQSAYKDMLPSIDIGASLTQAASSPRDALLTSPLWSLLGQLSAPLFHGGELKAAAQQAELETAISYQAYRETLLTAVNEVEQALDLERSLNKQQKHVQAALQNELNNLQQYERSYRQGLVDILDLLNVQQQTYDLQAQYDNLVYQRLNNRIALGLALGLGVKS